MLSNTNFGRIVITVVVLMMLLLPVASEINPLGLTAVFGQDSYLSNQSLSSSSSVLSENQKNNFKPFDYPISPTGINSGGTGIGSSSDYSSSSSNNNNNSSKLVILNFDDA
jgi:hypothetical protein